MIQKGRRHVKLLSCDYISVAVSECLTFLSTLSLMFNIYRLLAFFNFSKFAGSYVTSVKDHAISLETILIMTY